MEDEELPTEALVSAYVNLREEIASREREHEANMAGLKGQLETVSSALLATCNKMNADSIKTPSGTLTRRVNARYWTSDWESMREFIQEHDAFDLMERRLNSNNVKKFLEENPDLHPVGLQCDRKYVVTVRKPNQK